MASVNVQVERVVLPDSLTASFIVELPDGRVVEVWSDGTIQLWSPAEKLFEISLGKVK